MHRIIKFILVSIVAGVMFFVGTLIADKQYLRNEMIRIHVVANSDNEDDQEIKLMVKDAINRYLSEIIELQMSCNQAQEVIVNELPKLEDIARETLDAYECDDAVDITLTEEPFPVRKYETFTLPSGVYHSLRVKIGNAEGENWWCVAFPSLCEPAVSEDFHSAAVDSGLSDGLSRTIMNENGYEIRFVILDFFGRLENIFVKLMQ